jgi:hypothetical protein
MKKDTVYIDIEDDITAIIEKINAAEEKIVAIVPPKRSTVLGSVVNLKLIHKTAQDQTKRVVLITTDKTIISLAGGLGMYVAPNLQSAPAIPVVAAPPDELPSEVIKDSDPVPAKSAKAIAPTTAAAKGEEVVDDLSSGSAKDKKGFKVPKVPDFNRFKKKLFLYILGGVALVVLLIWMFYIAPKATITLAGQTSRLATDVEFTVDTSLKESNFDKKLLKATSKEIKREENQSFTPTGEEDLGKKATGTMTVTNCINDGKPHTLPKGTGFTSGEFRFVSSAAVTLAPALYSGSECRSASFGLSRTVPVSAAKGGDQYNLSSRTYTASSTNILATGSDMSGGTSEIVKVVARKDVDKAKEAALKKLREGIKGELAKEFDETVYVLSDSFGEILGSIKPSVPVGERADSASLSASATFYILGVERATMEEFLRHQHQAKLQPNQAIFKTGLDDATLTKTGGKGASRQNFQLKTDGYAGPDANMDELRGQLAGQSFGTAKSTLEDIPGVSQADIDLSPFWVYSLPRRSGNITITINVDQAQEGTTTPEDEQTEPTSQ